MSAANPLFSPTLESVQQSFDHWRATRGKRSRTPISLQRKAAALRSTYPASHICRALKINHTALKDWAHELQRGSNSLPVSPNTLVELPAEPIASVHSDSPAGMINSLSIKLDDSMQLHVHGRFTLEQLLIAARQHQRGGRT